MAVYEHFLPYIHIVCRYGTEERCLIEHGYRKMGYFSGFVQDKISRNPLQFRGRNSNTSDGISADPETKNIKVKYISMLDY